MMETHAYYSGDNYNYIVPGGKYSGYSQQSVDMAAKADLDNVYDPPQMPANPDSSIRVPVALESFNNSLNPELSLDFLQNESIVASANVPLSNDQDNIHYFTLYLKAGDYKLSFRVSADKHYDHPLTYRFIEYNSNDQSENYSDLTHGDSIILNENKNYKIIVF